MKQAHRQKNGAYKGLTRLGANGPVWTGDVRVVPEAIDYPRRLRKPHMIFVNSMSDLFHESLDFGTIFSVFLVMQACPQHTFQVLTKRPARMQEFIAWMETWGEATALAMNVPEYYAWPYPNVWLGVSAENQETANERLPLLFDTPAAVRWLSAEPLLGLIDLAQAGLEIRMRDLDGPDEINLNWVVVGGESGARARPMHPDWARSLRDQCMAAEIPFFFKQWGALLPVGVVKAGDEVVNGTAVYDQEGERLLPDCCSDDYEVDPEQVAIRFRSVGKKAAGRLLDDREWNEYPQVAGRDG